MESIADKLIFFIMLVIGVTMHEFGHAFAAAKLGDPLPRLQGRVTLNPLAHADPMGTFALPLIMIFSGVPLLVGWGKPVQVSLPNPKTRMRDDLVSTAAGPLANFALAIVSAFLLALSVKLGNEGLMKVAYISLFLNCVLMIFNLIPVPPLDGSHFLKYAVKMSHETYVNFSKYGIFILLALIFFTPFGEYLHWAITTLAESLANIFFTILNV